MLLHSLAYLDCSMQCDRRGREGGEEREEKVGEFVSKAFKEVEINRFKQLMWQAGL